MSAFMTFIQIALGYVIGAATMAALVVIIEHKSIEEKWSGERKEDSECH